MTQQTGIATTEEYHIARSTGEGVVLLMEGLGKVVDKISQPDTSVKDAVLVGSELGEYAEAEFTNESQQSSEQDAIAVAGELGDKGSVEVDDLNMYSPEKDAIGVAGELGDNPAYDPQGVIDRLNETIENNAVFEYEVVNIDDLELTDEYDMPGYETFDVDINERLSLVEPVDERYKAEAVETNQLSQDQQNAVFVSQNIERFADEQKNVASNENKLEPYERFNDPELFDSFVGPEFYEEEQNEQSVSPQENAGSAEDKQQSSEPAAESDQIKFLNTAYTEPDKVYAGERFNVEVKGDIRTITNKEGGVVFQFKNEGGKIEIIQDNMTDKDKAVMREVRESIDQARGKEGGMSGVLSDPTGTNQVETLKEFAPSGSHAIAVAGKLTDASQPEARGKDFTFRKTGEKEYVVLRNDGGIPNEKNVVALSKGGKITSVDQKPAELARFEKAYDDARNKVLSADKDNSRSRSRSRDR